MTNIEWTEETWNPIVGCSVISKGCTNCYAMKMAWRLSKMPATRDLYGPTVKKVNGNAVWTGKLGFNEKALVKPLHWKRPRRIFVNSMSDLFHEGVPDEWIDQIFAVMALMPQHTYQILTKRPERMREYLTQFNLSCNIIRAADKLWLGEMGNEYISDGRQRSYYGMFKPLPNVWLGVSVENNDQRWRLDYLAEIPAAKYFVSAEPLLGNLDLFEYLADRELDEIGGLDWVVVGGESGPRARPMHPDWARSLRDQCIASNTPFFFKQMSKKADIPDDLMIREYPNNE